MSNKRIHPGDLGAEIAATLSAYTDDIRENIEKDVKAVTKEARDTLRKTSPRRTGAYAQNWMTKTEKDTRGRFTMRVYNKKRYQLTHLLENGHKLKNGGMVPARPHIEPVERKANIEIIRKIKKTIRSQ